MLDPIARIVEQVEAATGLQVRPAKKLLLETKLRRRARALGLSSLEAYVAHFEAHAQEEAHEILSILTTHTTTFFRDPGQFDVLHDRVLPALVDSGRRIRIWSAACSTGEEVYSLAIAVLELLRERGKASTARTAVEIVGTDIDPVSISRARNGVYDRQAMDLLNTGVVTRYFDLGQGELEDMVRIRDEVHALCHFRELNLLSPPYTVRDADIIFLCNVLIYFSPDETRRVLAGMRESLVPGGHIFFGAAESLDEEDLPERKVSHSVYQLGTPTMPDTLVAATRPGPLRVLVIDDSRAVRCALRGLLREEKGFVVAGEAENPVEAEKLLAQLRPDVMTLDIQMPQQTGIEYLQTTHGRNRPPIVMLSSVSYEDADGAMRCFELGAFDYLEKPSQWDDPAFADLLFETLRCAVKLRSGHRGAPSAILPAPAIGRGKRDLILMGASTGGVEAFRRLLQELPADTPPVIIVQHLPARFTSGFTRRLAAIASVPVEETRDGAILERGRAYIAAGGKQTGVVSQGGKLRLAVTEVLSVSGHCPSVDYLFESAAKLVPSWRVSAALLTGMGSDGARGLKSLRDAGAHTVAESDETAIVFGMPQVAIALGSAREIVPLQGVIASLFKPFQLETASREARMGVAARYADRESF